MHISVLVANLAYILTVFCFIQIYSGPEVQPLSLVIATFWCIFSNKYKYKKNYSAFLIIFIFLLFNSIIHSLYKDTSLKVTLETAASIIFIYSGLIFFINNVNHIKEKVFFYVFYIWVLFALIQILLGESSIGIYVADFIRIFIPRYSNGLLHEWDRGSTLLAPEPSYSAPIIFLFFCLYRVKYYLIKGNFSTRIPFYAGLLILAFANRSGTLITIFVLYLFFIFILNIKKITFFKIILFFCLFYLFIKINLFLEVRVFVIFNELFLALADGINDDSIKLLLNFSGVRNVSVYVGYNSIFFSKDLFFGSWKDDFINHMYLMSIDPFTLEFFSGQHKSLVDIKPYSPVALMAFDFGLFGLMYFSFFILYVTFTNIRKMLLSNERFAMIIVSIFFIFFGQPVTMPTYILILALAKYGKNYNFTS